MGNKFKDLFIKSEEITQEESVNSAPTTSPIQNTNTVFQQAPVQPLSAIQADPKTVAMLQQHVIQNNLPGPDYLEILSTAKGLERYVPDESMRLEAAFDLLKQQYGESNLNKQRILNSIDTYIGMIEKERTSGLAICTEERHKRLDTAEEEIVRLQTSVNEIDKQIAELKEKKTNSVTKINQLEGERKEAEAEISTKEAVFNASVDQFISHLKEDKEKISNLKIQ